MLIGGIRRLDSAGVPSESDLLASDGMFTSLIRAVKHATEFAVTAILLSMMAHRQSVLNAASDNLIPQAAKKWLLNQPLIQPKGSPASLFDNVVPKLQKYTDNFLKLHPSTSAGSSHRSHF